MKDYPQLSEMGIVHPEQIDRFTVNSISNYDVLRIFYARRKGSFLPDSRTYKFLRVQKSAIVGRDTDQAETVMESDPALRSAVSELKDLLATKEQKRDLAESILEELRLLEEDVALRSACMKELVKQL